MSALRRGATGREVIALQKQLRARGFNPGVIDGDFGPGTEAAVLAFQKSEGLLADGVVGPRTAAALAGRKPARLPSSAAQFTVAVVARMFPHTPLGNIRRNLPPVLGALVKAQLHDRLMILMGLATIRAEAESFEPVAEGRSRYNSSPEGHPFDLYDNRRDLGNRGKPDGERFRGRGYAQLTGRFNYAKYGKALGLGNRLTRQPDLAGDPAIAGRLLAAFLKDRERRIKEALILGDFAGARRLVNGGSHGIERFTEAFVTGAALVPEA
jgi:peptidoglycan L-alanyl-D-glutamate endopeptidase CwlK